MKIISGGQTGADRGGLLAAQDLGIKTGGWVPKGYLTENGPDFSLKDFVLVQHSSSNYPPRTRMNCQDSDVTVIFGNINERGTKLTMSICNEENIPYIVNPIPHELYEFVCLYDADIVNIAGNRESKNPGIQEKVRRIVREAFKSIEK